MQIQFDVLTYVFTDETKIMNIKVTPRSFLLPSLLFPILDQAIDLFPALWINLHFVEFYTNVIKLYILLFV